ncbi:MAG: DNA cytosine methyltransferase [Armatimonadetes bacterium]|nr:DNA cytosine methyltransferase [Armatimonadota bacterium]
MKAGLKETPTKREAKTAPRKTVAEFFAGIGLVRLGLEAEGWRVVFANDMAADKYEKYAARVPDAQTHFGLEDIHTLSASLIPSVALATASFPCNDLSLAGMRDGLSGKAFVRLMPSMNRMFVPSLWPTSFLGILKSCGTLRTSLLFPREKRHSSIC